MKKFNSSSLLLLIAFSYCLIQGSFYPLLVLLFSLLHEGGHMLMIRLLNGKALSPRGGGQGFAIRFSSLTYHQEFIAAFAGPATNLMIAALISIFASSLGKIAASYCIYSNLMLAGVNLLPIFPLDGGRMLSCILACRMDPIQSAATLRWVGLVFLLLLLGIAFWQFLNSGYNISLLLICFYLAVLITAQSKGDFS